ncbi:methyltransferase domain-containing protein [Myxococcota bacterium]|nr:methyltransferase domain-containing protein [Myxococcota bacterium]
MSFPQSTPEHRLAFFRGFLKRPKEVGSVIPSSRFLERLIVRRAKLESARVVVELGPGTGGTTRALLAALQPDAKLLAVEINPHFVHLLRSHLRDSRMMVQEGSASQIREALDAFDLPAPDVILSGIPFSTMPRQLGLDILTSARDALAPDGRFVAYQFRDRVETLGREIFGHGSSQLELRNVPPMRVYTWKKRETSL